MNRWEESNIIKQDVFVKWSSEMKYQCSIATSSASLRPPLGNGVLPSVSISLVAEHWRYVFAVLRCERQWNKVANIALVTVHISFNLFLKKNINNFFLFFLEGNFHFSWQGSPATVLLTSASRSSKTLLQGSSGTLFRVSSCLKRVHFITSFLSQTSGVSLRLGCSTPLRMTRLRVSTKSSSPLHN